MKTAMQELIEALEKAKDHWKGDRKVDHDISTTYRAVILQAKCLLEKEKEQIEKAVRHGMNAPVFSSASNLSTDYYIETFKTA